MKLLDLLQLDPATHAVVLERTSDLTALAFYDLGAADALALMGEVAGFFAPSSVSPKALMTPGP